MYVDCPGSAGVYHRLDNLITSGTIQFKWIESVIVKAVCEFDEICYGNNQGGLYTQAFTNDTYMKHTQRDKFEEVRGQKIGDTFIGMLLIKNGNKKVFRKKADLSH